MKASLRSALLGALCATTALSAVPPEAFAMTVARPEALSLTSPTTQVHYQRYRHYGHWGYYRPRHYRHWGYYRPYYRPYYRRAYYGYPGYYGYPAYYGGYDPAGAMFAGAALGIMGAGIAAATAPRWGYGWGGWGPGWGWGGGWW